MPSRFPMSVYWSVSQLYSDVRTALVLATKIVRLADGLPQEWSAVDKAFDAYRTAPKLAGAITSAKRALASRPGTLNGLREANELLGLLPSTVFQATGSTAATAHEAALDYAGQVFDTAWGGQRGPLAAAQTAAEILKFWDDASQRVFFTFFTDVLTATHDIMVMEVESSALVEFDHDSEFTHTEQWSPVPVDDIFGARKVLPATAPALARARSGVDLCDDLAASLRQFADRSRLAKWGHETEELRKTHGELQDAVIAVEHLADSLGVPLPSLHQLEETIWPDRYHENLTAAQNEIASLRSAARRDQKLRAELAEDAPPPRAGEEAEVAERMVRETQEREEQLAVEARGMDACGGCISAFVEGDAAGVVAAAAEGQTKEKVATVLTAMTLDVREKGRLEKLEHYSEKVGWSRQNLYTHKAIREFMASCKTIGSVPRGWKADGRVEAEGRRATS